MVDKKGKLIILDNNKGKFSRTVPRIFDESGNPAVIKGGIMQLETFDMDKDGADDIVITDDSGELSILYGGSDASGTKFTKKVLATDLGLKLTSEAMNEGGAMHWDGLPEVQSPDQTDYYNESLALGQNPSTTDNSTSSALSATDQKRLLDSKLYYVAKTSRAVSSQAAATIRLKA